MARDQKHLLAELRSLISAVEVRPAPWIPICAFRLAKHKRPEPGQSLELIHAADQRMYEDKTEAKIGPAGPHPAFPTTTPKRPGKVRATP